MYGRPCVSAPCPTYLGAGQYPYWTDGSISGRYLYADSFPRAPGQVIGAAVEGGQPVEYGDSDRLHSLTYLPTN